MELNLGFEDRSLSSVRGNTPPNPGERLSQLCLGILQFLKSDPGETESLLPQAGATIRAEAERQLVPVLESALHSVHTKVRQELLNWLQMVQNLEQLGNNGTREPILAHLPSPQNCQPIPLPLESTSYQAVSSPDRELIIPPAPELFGPQHRPNFDVAEPQTGPSFQPESSSSSPQSRVDEVVLSEEDILPEESTSARQAEHLEEAEQLTARGYHARALECCGKAIMLAPDEPSPYFRRGQIHFLIGNTEKALKDVNTAIQLRCDDADAYVFRGNLWVAYGELPQALRDYSRAIQLDPSSSAALERRAWVRAKQQDWPEAIRDASAALALDPECSEALFIRGTAHANLNQDREALADLNEFLQNHTDHAGSYNERGKVYARLRRYDEALADYEAALHWKPDFVTARYNRAMVLSQTREFELALAAFTELIETLPENAILYYQRGRLYLSREDAIDAIVDLQRALDLKPRFPEAIRSLREARKLLNLTKTSAHVETLPEIPKLGKEAIENPRAVAESVRLDLGFSQSEEAELNAGPRSNDAVLKPPLRFDNSTNGKIEITCKGCGATRQVSFDRLNRQYQCQKCHRVFYVAQNGTMAEVKPRQQGYRRLLPSASRLLMVAVLGVCLLLGTTFFWQRINAKGGPNLPTDLETRVKLLAEAWLQDDSATIKRLTHGPQGRRLKYWLKDYPSPLAPQDREVSKRKNQTTIDLRITSDERNAVLLDLAVNHPLLSKSVTMKQEWVKEGDTWYFKPFP